MLCLLITFWPAGCSTSPPDAYAYFPESTRVAYRSDFVEFAEGRVDPDLAVEFRQWALRLAKQANQKATRIIQLNLDQKLSQVVILQVPSATAVVESARAGSDRVENLGSYRILIFDNGQSKPKWLGVAAIKPDIVAAGDAVAVRQVLAVAAGTEKTLYDARPDLRPLLETYATSQSAVFRFQPLRIAEGAGCLGSLFGGGNPLSSLIGVRGQAFASWKTEKQCSVSIAFQYGNRLPASVVSTVFGTLSLLNTIPAGIPEELGQPQSMDAEQDRGMAMLTADFDVAKCDEIDRKNREKKIIQPDRRRPSRR